jgi:hypothetical protein
MPPSPPKGQAPGLSIASGQAPPMKGIEDIGDVMISTLDEAGA